MNNANCTIVSWTPGRIRLRGAMLRAPGLLEGGAMHGIAEIDGVAAVLPNPKAASLTIVYDVEQMPGEMLLHKISQALGASFVAARGGSKKSSVLPPRARQIMVARRSRHKRSTRMQINRCAKGVMLATLGVSLALAAAGARNGHVLTGAMFVAALGVHLTIHRRHILR